MLLSAKAGDATNNHPFDKTRLKRRNRQIQDNLHLVQPIARHYAQQTGLESDDLLQVGCLGLIKAYNRYDAQRGAPFPSFAKPQIRGAILHFLRDRVGLTTPQGRSRTGHADDAQFGGLCSEPSRCPRG